MRETRVELNCWLEKEAGMWKQRSRVDWFKGRRPQYKCFPCKGIFLLLEKSNWRDCGFKWCLAGRGGRNWEGFCGILFRTFLFKQPHRIQWDFGSSSTESIQAHEWAIDKGVSTEWGCKEGKFLTYHKLTLHTTKSTKYSKLQSTTYCC